jgi:hypothetical protein
MQLFYEGGDITDITVANVIAVVPLPDASVLITFKVHGREGTRTYRFQNTVSEIIDSIPELAEFL